MPDTTEGEFRFEPLPGWMAGPVLRWYVHCDGVDWAILAFHAPEAEWRLRGLGPLQGLAAAWEGDPDQPVPVDGSMPAQLRRDAIALIALTALSRLRRAHETLDRLRDIASRAREEEKEAA